VVAQAVEVRVAVEPLAGVPAMVHHLLQRIEVPTRFPGAREGARKVVIHRIRMVVDAVQKRRRLREPFQMELKEWLQAAARRGE